METVGGRQLLELTVEVIDVNYIIIKRLRHIIVRYTNSALI